MYTKITKLAYVIPYLYRLSLGHNCFTNIILVLGRCLSYFIKLKRTSVELILL
jgi:hypothetical protein